MITNKPTLKQLTTLEKALLTFKYYNNIKSYVEIFEISHPELKKNPATIATRASAWKRSEPVQRFENELIAKEEVRKKAYIDNWINNQKQKALYNQQHEKGLQESATNNNGGENEGENGEIPFAPNWVNFQDLQEFLKYCENQANLLQDEREKQFYLKTISDLLRYKENDNATNDIQRFYTPIQCKDCILYKENQ